MLLLRRNDPLQALPGLFIKAFLPTMNFQPSQLPKIVGSGRAVSRRALFSFPLPF